MCIKNLFSKKEQPKKEQPGLERPSPQDWIKNTLHAEFLLGGVYRDVKGQLRLDALCLNLELGDDPYLSVLDISDTNSLDPVIDAGNGVIVIWGSSEQDQRTLIDALKEGDLVAYQGMSLIMHRIYSIINDNQGRGFRFLGDNNVGILDPDIVRDSQIKYLAIGTIY